MLGELSESSHGLGGNWYANIDEPQTATNDNKNLSNARRWPSEKTEQDWFGPGPYGPAPLDKVMGEDF